jgi:hypothetical protein
MSHASERLTSELGSLLNKGLITPEALIKTTQIVEDEIQSHKNSVVEQLKQMIDEWEATMGDSDKSLYSLGLRRAIDVVSGETAYSQLPVLEKPDTPDE